MEESLSVILLQRIAILSVIAYIFSHTRAFRYLFKEETTLREQFILMLFFSALSVGGTYMGVPVEGRVTSARRRMWTARMAKAAAGFRCARHFRLNGHSGQLREYRKPLNCKGCDDGRRRWSHGLNAGRP